MNTFARIMAGWLLVLAAPVLLAQSDWPNKPLRFVIPSPPGTSSDLLVRALFESTSKTLGQSAVTEPRPGAGGTLALEAVAKAAPDGYTFGMASLGSLGIGPNVYRSLRFDAQKELVGVARVASTANMIVVPSEVPVANLQEFISYARERPGKLNFAQIGGPGTSFHLTWEMFSRASGLNIVQVGFKDNPPAIQGLLSGALQVAMGAPNQFLAQLRSGRLRGLAVTSERRDPSVPDVPTMAEAGFPGYVLPSWFGIVAPAATPRAIVERLSREVLASLASAETASALAKVGFAAAPQPATEFDAFFRSEIARWGKVAKDAGVTVE